MIVVIVVVVVVLCGEDTTTTMHDRGFFEKRPAVANNMSQSRRRTQTRASDKHRVWKILNNDIHRSLVRSIKCDPEISACPYSRVLLFD